MNNPLMRSLFGSAGLRIANAGLGFAVAVVLARSLGTEGYGIYSTAFVVASISAIAVQVGLPSLVMRETAVAAAAGDWTRIWALWRWATRSVLRFSMVIVVLGVITLAVLYNGVSGVYFFTFLLALALVPAVALVALRASALRGLQNVVLAQVPELIVKPGVMLVLAVLLGLVVPASPAVAMAMQLGAVLTAFLVGSLLLVKRTPSGLANEGQALDRVTTARFTRAAIQMAIVGASGQIYLYSDILALSIFSNPATVGTYRVAYQFALLGSLPNAIIYAIAGARFAVLSGENGNALVLRHLMSRYRLAAGIPTALIFVTFVAFGRSGLETLYGDEFGNSYIPALFLMGVHLANAVFGPLGEYLNMTGRESECARMASYAAIIAIVLNILFVIQWEAQGVAAATLLTYLALNTGLLYVARRKG